MRVKKECAEIPFSDENGVMHVGGRLKRHWAVTLHKMWFKKYSVLRKLIQWIHQRCLHGGVVVTLQPLRQHAWVFQARKLIYTVIFHGITCIRLKAVTSTQVMSSFICLLFVYHVPLSHFYTVVSTTRDPYTSASSVRSRTKSSNRIHFVIRVPLRESNSFGIRLILQPLSRLSNDLLRDATYLAACIVTKVPLLRR